jgi:hypothetical protein
MNAQEREEGVTMFAVATVKVGHKIR